MNVAQANPNAPAASGGAWLRLPTVSGTVEAAALGTGVFRFRLVAPPCGATGPAARAGAGTGGVIALRAGPVSLQVQGSPFVLTIGDGREPPLLATAPESPVHWAGEWVTARFAAPRHLRCYGLPERTGPADLYGRRLSIWNRDTSPHTPTADPLYACIPFLLAVEPRGAWGLLVESPGQGEFDLAGDGRHLTFRVSHGTFDATFFYGPSPAEVLRRYTALVGRMPLPPRWALGYQQSKWSYASEAEVRRVARSFRERRIPCDVIYLDIDYMDGFRVFTWNPETFPNPTGLLSDLAREGFRVVAIVDPGVKVEPGYPVWEEGKAHGYFLTDPTGAPRIGVVWPGDVAFPDFLRPEVRSWWGKHHRVLVDAGVAGIWNDMNEPTVFRPGPDNSLPADTYHAGGVPHARVHNLYANAMAQAAYEALLRLAPGRRPFVLTRAAYAGIQRYAALWTGDNSSWWEHLAMMVPMLTNLGLAGVPFAGADVGGFHDTCTGELFTRWVQAAVFTPLCRAHSAKGVEAQEPWRWGEPYESICRRFIELRYQLLPYLYSLFDEASRTGAPVLRPLFWDDPASPDPHEAWDQFLLGPWLLVAPVTRPGAARRLVYLPQGVWWHFFTGERFAGPAWIVAQAPLEHIPVFVRGGAVLPRAAAAPHTGAYEPASLELQVYPGGDGEQSFTLYEDDGDGFRYQEGFFTRTCLATERAREHLKIRIGPVEGRGALPRACWPVALLHLAAAPREVQLNGCPLPGRWDPAGRAFRFSLPARQATGDILEVSVRL